MQRERRESRVETFCFNSPRALKTGWVNCVRSGETLEMEVNSSRGAVGRRGGEGEHGSSTRPFVFVTRFAAWRRFARSDRSPGVRGVTKYLHGVIESEEEGQEAARGPD